MRDGREWLDNDGCFLFGKYGPPSPSSVEDVAHEDPSYLRWILETAEDIDHEDKGVIETALRFNGRKRR